MLQAQTYGVKSGEFTVSVFSISATLTVQVSCTRVLVVFIRMRSEGISDSVSHGKASELTTRDEFLNVLGRFAVRCQVSQAAFDASYFI